MDSTQPMITPTATQTTNNNYISPHIPGGEGFLIYALEEAGEYHIIGDFSEQRYLDLMRSGVLPLRTGDVWRQIQPKIIIYAKSLHGFDFILHERNIRYDLSNNTNNS